MSTTADHGAREAIASRLDRTLFVEAGAGTGKTTALVGRIVEHVLVGVPLPSIAAITFTEAAAAELRERIRFRLEQVVRTRRAGLDDRDLDDEQVERARLALDAVDEAALQTLHGFAQRLLSTHAIDAGLPPGFTLRDAPAMEQAFADRWSELFRSLVADPTMRDVLHMAFALGLRHDELAVVARAFHDSWDLLVRSSTPLDVSPDLDVEPLIGILEGALDLRSACRVPGDLLLAHLDEKVEPYVAALRAAAGSPVDVARLLLGKITNGKGQAQAWQGRKPEVVAALDAAEAERTRMRASVTEWHLHAILERIRRFTLDGARQRAADGVLEFHDLLVRARDLLAENAGVRAGLRKRFTHILVDEFQDTDPLQIELATRLGAAGHAADWRELGVDPGRLFLVGDPKQSIYRFRRADLDLYRQVREHYAAGLEQLTVNWRTTQPILDAVNAAFGPWFREGELQGQAPWEALVAGRTSGPERSSTVAVLGGDDASTADGARALAAADVVEVARLARSQRWQVADAAAPEGWRDARLDDIAVLIPTRTVLPALERALIDGGIPFRVESRSLVWSTQEVRDVLSVLRAVDDPGDEVATVAALSSVAFGCGEDDLVSWAAAQGRFSHAAAFPSALPLDHPVARGLAWMADLAGERSRLLVSDAVRRVIAGCSLTEVAITLPRQRETWARLRFLEEQALAFEASGAEGLRRFLDWADRQADEDAQALESVVPDPDDEAVRIVTIHAAKGLEYPIVVLAGLGARRNVDATQVLWRADGRPEVSCGALERGWRTRGFPDARVDDQTKARAEEARLLYVACTRARDHLVVCVHRAASRKKGGDADVAPGSLANAAELAARLGPAVALRSIEELQSRFPIHAVSLVPPATDPGSAADEAAALARAARHRLEAIDAAARPRVVSPSGLAAMRDLDAVPSLALGLDDPESRPSTTELVDVSAANDVAAPDEVALAEPAATRPPRPGSGTAFGLAVHALAELAPLVLDGDPAAWSWDELAARAAAAAASNDLAPEAARAVERAVRAAITSPIAVEAGGAERCWRELPVAAEVDGVVVEGIVDLCFHRTSGRRQGLVVVDWKSGAIGADGVGHKAEVYTPQLAAYAVALEAVTGLEVVQCSLVFCGSGTAVQHDILGKGLDAAKAATHLRLQRLSAG